jgi:polyphosphate kinase 2 (PPK2 family)
MGVKQVITARMAKRAGAKAAVPEIKINQLVKRARKLGRAFRVSDGDGFRLKGVDPGDTLDFTAEDKPRAKEALAMGVEALAELQDMLYAQDRWAVLLIFQAMDAAGKDGAIKHVMSGLNPQGCQVYSFKAPSSEDLDHDFFWRCLKSLPERGRIGIFNRSYYEETLVVRVHRELLDKQKLPAGTIDKDIFAHRFRTSGRRALSRAERHGRLQDIPARVEAGAEEAVPRAPRSPGQELEVQLRRRARA